MTCHVSLLAIITIIFIIFVRLTRVNGTLLVMNESSAKSEVAYANVVRAMNRNTGIMTRAKQDLLDIGQAIRNMKMMVRKLYPDEIQSTLSTDSSNGCTDSDQVATIDKKIHDEGTIDGSVIDASVEKQDEDGTETRTIDT
eukprot:m.45874 g.45874  ORF g.45874 m.45874 type:complete len:141 (+) comp7239_c0_seq1:83-505(+)